MSNEARKSPRSLIALFLAQVAAFAVMLGAAFLPFLRTFIRPIYVALMILHFLLGLALLILSIRAKPRGALRRFLMLTGAASMGFVVSGVLHNAFYGLATLADDRPILEQMMKGLEVVFFIIAVIVCPVCFIVGVVGTVAVLLRRGTQDGPK